MAYGHPGLAISDEQASTAAPGDLIPMYWADDPGGEIIAYFVPAFGSWVDKAWAEDPANEGTLGDLRAVGQDLIDASYNPTPEDAAFADQTRAEFEGADSGTVDL